MANRWGNNGKSVRVYFLELQNHCRWWLKPWNYKTLAPWKKRYEQSRQHIKKQKHYFTNKRPSSQSYDFSSSHVWMWELKKAECQRIDAFEMWCWCRLLRVPCTIRRSYQSILKEISPQYSLEGLMLKLKLEYFGHLMQRADLLKKILKLGKTERGRRGWQRMRWLGGVTNMIDMSLGNLQELVMDREVWPGEIPWMEEPGGLQSMESRGVRQDWVTSL